MARSNQMLLVEQFGGKCSHQAPWQLCLREVAAVDAAVPVEHAQVRGTLKASVQLAQVGDDIVPVLHVRPPALSFDDSPREARARRSVGGGARRGGQWSSSSCSSGGGRGGLGLARGSGCVTRRGAAQKLTRTHLAEAPRWRGAGMIESSRCHVSQRKCGLLRAGLLKLIGKGEQQAGFARLELGPGDSCCRCGASNARFHALGGSKTADGPRGLFTTYFSSAGRAFRRIDRREKRENT